MPSPGKRIEDDINDLTFKIMARIKSGKESFDIESLSLKLFGLLFGDLTNDQPGYIERYLRSTVSSQYRNRFDDHEIKDILQNVALDFFTMLRDKPDSFCKIRDILPYTKTVAYNWLRRALKQKTRENDLVTSVEIPEATYVDQQFNNVVEEDFFEVVVNRLPVRYSRLLSLRYKEHRDIDEIIGMMALGSRENYYRVLSRARKRAREIAQA